MSKETNLTFMVGVVKLGLATGYKSARALLRRYLYNQMPHLFLSPSDPAVYIKQGKLPFYFEELWPQYVGTFEEPTEEEFNEALSREDKHADPVQGPR